MSTAENRPAEKMMFQLNLRRRGISDQAVLRAMDQVDREVFVEPRDRGNAFRDTALGIACGQTISQPFVVAYMTDQLRLKAGQRVLEIGTGSGYQAAILAKLCKQVVSVERFRTLADGARKRLARLGCEMSKSCWATALRSRRRWASSTASSSPRRWSRSRRR